MYFDPLSGSERSSQTLHALETWGVEDGKELLLAVPVDWNGFMMVKAQVSRSTCYNTHGGEMVETISLTHYVTEGWTSA